MQSVANASLSSIRLIAPAAETPSVAGPVGLAIPVRRVTLCLLAMVSALLSLHVLGAVATFYFDSPSVFGFVPTFSLNSEANIPAWYASVVLLVCAALFGLIAFFKQSRGDRYARHWTGLALIFLYMSADEGGQLHELLTEPSGRVLGDADGWLHFAWTAPALLIIAVVARAYLGFLFHLPRDIARLFVLAGAMYLGGAIGMEIVGGWYLANHGDTFTYALMTGLEESLEMLGVVLAIYTQLRYIASTTGSVEVTMRRDAVH
jgi:hypothetical protein